MQSIPHVAQWVKGGEGGYLSRETNVERVDKGTKVALTDCNRVAWKLARSPCRWFASVIERVSWMYVLPMSARMTNKYHGMC